MAARRTRSRSRAGRRSRRLWPPLELPPLEQRHQDLIGLGLVGCAAFFACVFYLGWDGGEAGAAVADGVRFVLGGVAYVAPVALFVPARCWWCARCFRRSIRSRRAPPA